ncbi:MAG TPA: hypothetical protein VNX23_09035, partial [Bradyrhizobium sp.]|uniref:hypothetical protein n=1 Tax=Bradyrhizobium sp. TaxID=376 RepID=UPI002B952330
RPRFLLEFARIGKQSDQTEFTTPTTLKNSRNQTGGTAVSTMLWLVGLWLVSNGLIAAFLIWRRRGRTDNVQRMPFLVLSQDSSAPPPSV